MALRRIGILTGGGDCPGLNAVIRAVVKSAFFQHGIEVFGILDGYSGLVEGRSRPLTEEEVSGILPRGGTILGTTNRANPFHYQSDLQAGKPEDRSRDALKFVEKLQLGGLVIVGGDGTLTVAEKLSRLGLNIIAIPKTIDNDLSATDVTFGFDTALSIATEAVDRLHTTAESHHRAMVLEVMGRYAGWIALRAGIAGGGDIILIPEIPYDPEKVCEAIRQRMKRGKHFSIVVAAEGARPINGEMVVKQVVKNSPDPVRLGGIGEVVAQQIECSSMESRVTVLGHLQRGGTPTAFDRWLATQFGTYAVELFVQGQFGRMVALKGREIDSVPLQDAIAEPRRVDPASREVLSARAVGTSFGD